MRPFYKRQGRLQEMIQTSGPVLNIDEVREGPLGLAAMAGPQPQTQGREYPLRPRPSRPF